MPTNLDLHMIVPRSEEHRHGTPTHIAPVGSSVYGRPEYAICNVAFMRDGRKDKHMISLVYRASWSPMLRSTSQPISISPCLT